MMENRGCNCGAGNHMMYVPAGFNNNPMQGNCEDNNIDMSMSAYNVTGVNVDCMEKEKTERDCRREEMMMQIRELDFAIVELGLYLDTHPDDQKALCLHREYAKKLKDLKDKYQKVYGPLTNHYPCNKWRWLEEPWPWERGNY